ncbi:amidohydrolase family protein [Thiomicrorhabdus aquaedulcis]|uniref:amidohydrolase family protein n=1 Tax=Thiomicrorhabdus aquaedulcis TaxID=2211106 RepID=UPI000FD6DC6E|nr:amidohydrolase family protein [Thiomicrorhabdus aquaedulcis]
MQPTLRTSQQSQTKLMGSFKRFWLVLMGLLLAALMQMMSLTAQASATANSHLAQTKTSVLPIFDAHLHYGGEDSQAFSSQQVLQIFERNRISHALISSTPNDGTEALYRAAPDKIVPFLAFYESLAEKGRWGDNWAVIERIERQLKSGIYRGIGEFHLFKEHQKSPVLRKVVEIAAERNLMLQVHSDAEIIGEIFSINPKAVVLWAHLGTQPEPAFLADMLNRYPQGLYIDTTVRDALFVDDAGRLKPEWHALFVAHSQRFLVGVDTYSVNRWHNFDTVVSNIRAWLGQLPDDVARRLAHENAEALFLKK